jgi:hypothetical protein
MAAVLRHIRNQGEHHRQHSFKPEWWGMLKAYEIAYEDRFLFDFIAPEQPVLDSAPMERGDQKKDA